MLAATPSELYLLERNPRALLEVVHVQERGVTAEQSSG
jgi:hypothetical protein